MKSLSISPPATALQKQSSRSGNLTTITKTVAVDILNGFFQNYTASGKPRKHHKRMQT
jgi:hypothetical protein